MFFPFSRIFLFTGQIRKEYAKEMQGLRNFFLPLPFREWRMENGEWRMENGEWRMENGEWRMENMKITAI